MASAHPNSFKSRKSLTVGSKAYTYYSLKAAEKQLGDLSRLPFSLKVVLENLLRALHFEETEKTFDPKKVYGDAPNPTIL